MWLFSCLSKKLRRNATGRAYKRSARIKTVVATQMTSWTSANKVWVKCVNLPGFGAFKVSIDDVVDVDDLKKAITEEAIRRNHPISVSHIVDAANQPYDAQALVAEIFPDLFKRTVLFTTYLLAQKKLDTTSLSLGLGKFTALSLAPASRAIVPIELYACDLTVPVTECVRPADHTFCCKHLVELEEMLEHAMLHVDNFAHVKGGLQERVPPLVHATLPRGGKTTFLLLLFDRLKSAGYAPIFVSLCNLTSVIPGETDREKLVRSIATQFVGGVSSDQLSLLTIDEDVLWDHIEATRAGKNVVLLIDELHQLSLPLDGHASQMLKVEWLDKMGRYFVFTANVPLKTDAPRQKASRTLQCIDVHKYREVVILKPSQLLETMMFLEL